MRKGLAIVLVTLSCGGARVADRAPPTASRGPNELLPPAAFDGVVDPTERTRSEMLRVGREGRIGCRSKWQPAH
jgi:hypothetical protein